MFLFQAFPTRRQRILESLGGQLSRTIALKFALGVPEEIERVLNENTQGVSHRALMARVNRTLKSEHKQMFRSRKDTHEFAQFGAYYIVGETAVTQHHVDLADYATKLKLLRPFEVLESEEKQ
jgi:hypothetical protein